MKPRLVLLLTRDPKLLLPKTCFTVLRPILQLVQFPEGIPFY
jgi:hypothetical protein